MDLILKLLGEALNGFVELSDLLFRRSSFLLHFESLDSSTKLVDFILRRHRHGLF